LSASISKAKRQIENDNCALPKNSRTWGSTAGRVGQGCPQPAASLKDASCRQRRVEDNAALPTAAKRPIRR
jgi:hypothetical protein